MQTLWLPIMQMMLSAIVVINYRLTGNYSVYKVVDLFGEGNMLVEIGSWSVLNPSGVEVDKGHYMSYFRKTDEKYACVRDMNVTSTPIKPVIQ
jgi:hypothetical protein